MFNKKTKDLTYIYLSHEELVNPRIRVLIKELINQKLIMQKYNDFIKVGILEFHLIQDIFRGEFVPKEKYNNMTNFKNEFGKLRGKRVIISEEGN